MEHDRSAVFETATGLCRSLLFTCVVMLALTLPEVALATPGGFEGEVCGFMGKIRNLLNVLSIAVVTVAVIFAGYQIAFAHKRIADVAPILIGGVLIGAAGQLANLLIGDDATDCTAMLQIAAPLLYA